MRTKSLIIIAALALCAVFVQAQENVPPTSTGTFFDTAKNYFTSFNTNLDSTFALERGEVAVGVDSRQGGGIPLANSIRMSVMAYKFIGIDALIRDGGVTGTIVSEQFGPAAHLRVHDVDVAFYGHGGYRQEDIVGRHDRLFGAFGIRVQKALTEHTFAGVGAEFQVPNNDRSFSAYTGFTF